MELRARATRSVLSGQSTCWLSILFLTAHEAAGRALPEPRSFLARARPGDQVVLPEEVYLALPKIVDAMQSGLAGCPPLVAHRNRECRSGLKPPLSSRLRAM